MAFLCLAFAFSACGGDSSSVAPRDEDSSSSVCEDCDDSSSSKKVSSSSKEKTSSSRNDDLEESSSSSAKSSSSRNKSSSSKKVSSSSKGKTSSSSSSSDNDKSCSSKGTEPAEESSSSEYVPFDHSQTLAGAYKVGEDAYKTFTDPRNGRSYYYITITSDYSGKSVTVMAENLNIGEMVLGTENQANDTLIERYCYNNDTTKCDEFGGLYQWAEMMQLPSRCNTESCADLIQEDHRGICPVGWRLFTYDDYEIVRGYKDENGDGIKGLRSTYGFSGTNASGFSLTGAGMRTKLGAFDGLKEVMAWFRPEEYESDAANRAHHGLFDNNDFAPAKENRDLKVNGFSVRCVMLEKKPEE
ncbi:FISUMP domain-containing protein [Fibrobacter sp.]|uniref:FISUMP domain-containing protein n=1 Tax=Fibrobacter sp. TaxID=35828 RepID=UPI0025B9F136|nr:FISUMP domain-containing protein [Fibrobacter sp.]